MTFGEKLYRLRTERGMSQETLAGMLGVSRQAISRWELEEVVPDTANVLAVSRVFGVSLDYLLKNEETSAASLFTPPKTAEESLRERQTEVGCAMGYRFLVLAGPAVWYLNAGREDTSLLLPFTLCWTVIFGILLARTMTKARVRDLHAANRLLRNDIFATCCICFLPLFFKWLPGNLEILLSQLAAVPFVAKNWTLLRRIYGLPHKKKKQK